jgi:hypothetical protein
MNTYDPLFISLGLSAKDSSDVYVETREALQQGKDVRTILNSIADMPTWSTRKKIYAAYQLRAGWF